MTVWYGKSECLDTRSQYHVCIHVGRCIYNHTYEVVQQSLHLRQKRLSTLAILLMIKQV